jgi:hypothetical protein
VRGGEKGKGTLLFTLRTEIAAYAHGYGACY